MKICIISGTFPPVRCGVGDYASLLADHLAAEANEVNIITTKYAKVNTQSKIKIYPIINTWHLFSLNNLFKQIVSLNPEVVHLQYPTASYGRGLAPNLIFFMLRCFCPKIKCVLTLHEYAIFSILGKIRLSPLILAAHKILCTNHNDRRKIRDFHPKSRAKVKVLPLASNINILKITNISKQELKAGLVHFGTVMPNKGWENILMAWKILIEENCKLKLLVLGELQPDKYAYHKQIEKLIEKYGLNKYIKFTGYLKPEEVSNKLSKAQIAIQPYTQGASLNRSSLIAVLVHGLAVITTKSDINLEGLKAGQHFLAIPKDDPKALAEIIKKLIGDPKQVKLLQQEAGKKLTRFNWDKIIQRLTRIYHEELSKI